MNPKGMRIGDVCLLLWCIAAAIIAGPACGGGEQEPLPPFEAVSASQRLWTERQGIGPDWFDFLFGRGMAVVPKKYVYAVEDGNEINYMEIIGYLSERAQWGYFTIDIAHGDEPPVRISSDTDVQKKPICLQLHPAKFVDCTQPHDFFLSAHRRAILDVTLDFPVPSIISSQLKNRKIYAIPAKEIGDVDRAHLSWKKGATPLPDAYTDPSESRIAGAKTGSIQVSVAPDGRFTAWTYDETSETSVAFHTLCPQGPSELPLGSGKESTFQTPTLERGALYGIKLCDQQTVEIEKPMSPELSLNTLQVMTISTPFNELPPSKRGFDLYLFVRGDGQKELLLSPDRISIDWGASTKKTKLIDAKGLQLKRKDVKFADIN